MLILLSFINIYHSFTELSESFFTLHQLRTFHIFLHKTLLCLQILAQLFLQQHVLLLQLAILLLQLFIHLSQLSAVLIIRSWRSHISSLVVIPKTPNLQKIWSNTALLIQLRNWLLWWVSVTSEYRHNCVLLKETLSLIADCRQADIMLHFIDIDVLWKHEFLHVVNSLEQFFIKDACLESAEFSFFFALS
jgi:hypothetical protein